MIDGQPSDIEALAERACSLARIGPEGRAWAVFAQPADLPADPLPLHASATGRRRLLWWGKRWLLAVGESKSVGCNGPSRVLAMARAVSRLEALTMVGCASRREPPAPLVLAEMAFEDRSPGPGHWGPALPGARLVLPRRAWLRDGSQGWVIDALPVTADDHPSDVAAALTAPLPDDLGPAPIPTKAWDRLRLPAFTDLVQDAVSLLRHGALRKVVLARAVDSDLGREPDMVKVLARLRRQGDTDSCVYATDLDDGSIFCGATPELLLATHGEALATMALAGSRARSRTPAEDRALGREMLASAKERTEHQLVVDHIVHQLGLRCQELAIPERPRVRRLPLVQHLETRITGRLPDADPLDLVAALHPTPAVCGLPVPAASEWLQRREALHRGLYTGVLGWLTPRDSRFVVPLRGGIVRGSQARLFAGAGIIETSDPDRELAETELKLGPMREALELG